LVDAAALGEATFITARGKQLVSYYNRPSNVTVTQSEGDPNAKIIVVSSVPSWEGKPLSETAKDYILATAKSCGINPQDIRYETILDNVPPSRKWESVSQAERQSCSLRFNGIHARTNGIFVPLDCGSLEALTDHSSIDDWQLSIIGASKLAGQKTIPIYHPERVFADPKLYPFFRFGWQRVKQQMEFPEIKRVGRSFFVEPSFDEAMRYLKHCLISDMLSVDIETAYGQITCVGFARSPNDAICIPTLPSDWPQHEFYELWRRINDVLNGDARKIFQNFIYDASYFSRYGCSVRNLWTDTMLAQKFLHPELPMGLDTIARLYTEEPYWKDEGKDWRDIGDKRRFWEYNCKDTTVTFEAALAQRRDLVARGLESAFDLRVMQMASPAAEMCWRGLPVDGAKRAELSLATDATIRSLNAQLDESVLPVLGGKKINSRSPQQVKAYLKAKGYRIPIKKGKETSDQTALMKLLLKAPDDKALKLLLELSDRNKFMSSYLKPEPYPDGRLRFSLNIHGTEPGRWSSSKDAFGRGFNAQTISAELKKIFVAPPGWEFLEVDLRQADSRFVAWDAPEPTLIEMYMGNVDIHRFVASRPELFNKPPQEISKDERQLGKKVGHASNYGMRGNRLSEICLLEMGVTVSPSRANAMLEGYHRVFPGIRMWQNRIASEIRRTKKLSTPMGRERYFYGRVDDNLYREAYAYKPPSVVNDVINSLIRFVDEHRDPEQLHFVLQAHDAAIMLVQKEYMPQALRLVGAESEWNPKIPLMGGILQIPIEAKAGECWGSVKEIACA